jgi:hypothetical protein
LKVRETTLSATRRNASNQPGLLFGHLIGRYSLGRSFWLHTVVIGWIVAFAGGYACNWIGERWPVRYLSMAVLVLQPIFILVWLWSTAGTVVSAVRRLFSGPSRWWAVLALLVLAGSVEGMHQQLRSLRPFVAEHWAVARGEQAGAPFRVTTQADGRAVIFSGATNEGAATALEAAVKAAPKATLVVLDSPGGWVKEGLLMADVIHRYNMSTHVDKTCASACTLAFLAGLDRTAGPDSRLGFHQGRAIGESADDDRSLSQRELAQMYQRAGVAPDFARHVVQVPSNDIWVPSRNELLRAQVLTR